MTSTKIFLAAFCLTFIGKSLAAVPSTKEKACPPVTAINTDPGVFISVMGDTPEGSLRDTNTLIYRRDLVCSKYLGHDVGTVRIVKNILQD